MIVASAERLDAFQDATYAYRVILFDFDLETASASVVELFHVHQLADIAQWPEYIDGVHHVVKGVGEQPVETDCLSLAEALEALV